MGLWGAFKTGIGYIPVVGDPLEDVLNLGEDIVDKVRGSAEVRESITGRQTLEIKLPKPKPKAVDTRVDPIPPTNHPGDNILNSATAGVNIGGRNIPYLVLAGGALLALNMVKK